MPASLTLETLVFYRNENGPKASNRRYLRGTCYPLHPLRFNMPILHNNPTPKGCKGFAAGTRVGGARARVWGVFVDLSLTSLTSNRSNPVCGCKVRKGSSLFYPLQPLTPLTPLEGGRR